MKENPTKMDDLEGKPTIFGNTHRIDDANTPTILRCLRCTVYVLLQVNSFEDVFHIIVDTCDMLVSY